MVRQVKFNVRRAKLIVVAEQNQWFAASRSAISIGLYGSTLDPVILVWKMGVLMSIPAGGRGGSKSPHPLLLLYEVGVSPLGLWRPTPHCIPL